MPLHQTYRFGPDCGAILWQITEAEPALWADLPQTPGEAAELAGIAHPVQRVEWLACRRALQHLLHTEEIPYTGLQKDEWGKPHLVDGTGGFISLSHTEGWAAAAWHRGRAVGIDVEPLREQLRRVVPRVLSASENADAAGDVNRLAVYWCAKEALYKLYGKRRLTFREHLHVDPFPDGATQLTGHVRLPDHVDTLAIHCQFIELGLLAVAF